jgi:hypothetical protein
MEKIAILCVLIASILVASSWAGIVSGWSSRFRSSQQTRDVLPKRGQPIGARSVLFVIAVVSAL